MTHQDAAALADAIANKVATPAQAVPTWKHQSLAKGHAGIALLHIQRARSGRGTWATAHAWLTSAASVDLSVAENASLYIGAPAVAYAVHAAGDDSERYEATRRKLAGLVARLAYQRVDQAHARMDRRELPELREFDLLGGLTGLGALLLQSQPEGEALAAILSYLVRLARPIRADGVDLPGWWTPTGPDFEITPTFPGGHANFGIAHGITGPLALLALAANQGLTVEGHHDAMHEICRWLDAWRQDHQRGSWWPQWIGREELSTGIVRQPSPLRPSWCYGTPGQARAQQLAGLALGDTTRQLAAECALARCIQDTIQLRQITDDSLCHGWAGVYQTVARAAADASEPTLNELLPLVARELVAFGGKSETIGLLEGDAGAALALHTAATGNPAFGWDRCLLLT
ncbi:hypothetical protein GCM10010124_02490 [Pilimelia terevasa]|uniref:Lanthionine synthetase n=1 Tax=Pilimelia terevasa TaxID=53372 RepID=A0A8J3BIG1_9ACTN|nr:lanthionine synthetase C family protein [Pilimelia terevasa]GGK13439.1 hypothetical protein GCM10010124_02490 [Pilimelia terevasa]